MPQNTIEIDCDLCGSKDRKLVTTENDFPIYRCAECTFVYVGRIPVVEAGRVVGEYYEEDRAEVETNRERYVGVIKFLLDEAARLKNPGKILDVGCGFGFFLSAARSRGWETYGTELSEAAVAYARDENGLDNVIYSDLENADFGETKFDVINLTNVLEHVPSATAILSACKARLAADGILLIRVPNMEFNDLKQTMVPVLRAAGLARGGEGCYLASPPPLHLTGFSSKTIRRYFDKTGLTAIEIKPSKLSGMANENAAYKLFEKSVAIIFGVSMKTVNLSPTILAIAGNGAR